MVSKINEKFLHKTYYVNSQIDSVASEETTRRTRFVGWKFNPRRPKAPTGTLRRRFRLDCRRRRGDRRTVDILRIPLQSRDRVMDAEGWTFVRFFSADFFRRSSLRTRPALQRCRLRNVVLRKWSIRVCPHCRGPPCTAGERDPREREMGGKKRIKPLETANLPGKRGRHFAFSTSDTDYGKLLDANGACQALASKIRSRSSPPVTPERRKKQARDENNLKKKKTESNEWSSIIDRD